MDSPDEDNGNEGDDGSDDSEGMAARLDRILEGPTQADVVVPRMGSPKGASSGSRDGQRGESSLCLRKVGPSPTPNLLQRLRWAIGLSL